MGWSCGSDEYSSSCVTRDAASVATSARRRRSVLLSSTEPIRPFSFRALGDVRRETWDVRRVRRETCRECGVCDLGCLSCSAVRSHVLVMNPALRMNSSLLQKCSLCTLLPLQPTPCIPSCSPSKQSLPAAPPCSPSLQYPTSLLPLPPCSSLLPLSAPSCRQPLPPTVPPLTWSWSCSRTASVGSSSACCTPCPGGTRPLPSSAAATGCSDLKLVRSWSMGAFHFHVRRSPLAKRRNFAPGLKTGRSGPSQPFWPTRFAFATTLKSGLFPGAPDQSL